ncbi:MAG: hypothetical protein KF729_36930 [Sandaracinaceae bacterium]|nr:hypothetical protein [Sandaracinaceae bacterium]
MPARALVVCATDVLARGALAWAADRATDPSGAPTGALYAVARAIRGASASKPPDLAVALLDADGAGEALAAQHARLEGLLSAYGLTAVRATRPLELAASYARAAREAGCDVVVVGADKRLAQLVSEETWWYDPFKDVRYTPGIVAKRFGVPPAQVAEWLALVGDDGAMPGISGIGAKGATDLLARFGSVEAALASLDTIRGRTGNALRAAGDTVARELARARLDASLPLPVALDALAHAPPSAEALDAADRALGFRSLLSHAGEAAVAVDVCDRSSSLQASLSGLGEGPIALYPVTEDPAPIHGALVGVAFSSGDGRALYVPLAGRGRHLAPADLAAFLAEPAIGKVAHDGKAACVAFGRHGVEIAPLVGDSAYASHLAEPSGWAPHDLPTVARRALGRGLPSEDDVRGVGRARRRWSALPVEAVARYAGAMADASAALWRALAPRTSRALLDEYIALGALLRRMEERGIACDAAELARAGADFEREGEALERAIHAHAGHAFNVGSTKQLGEVLYRELGLPVPMRTKTGWSTATEALERIARAHPIVELVIRWRMLRRLTDTWVTALARHVDPDGRVRSTFHLARSFSGRLVNSSPDLGRVPKKTPQMRRIRRAFHAPPGAVLLSVDYRQLGLYVLAHLTGDPALVEPLREGADMHALTAAAVLDRALEDVDYDARQVGKVVSFATFAGQGESALAQQLGVPVAEARDLIARFDRRYAIVRAFQEEQLRLARERGWIETIAGRRWPIGELDSPDPMIRAYAERLARRATHEASVADVARRGLLRAGEALAAAGLEAMPVLTVLDEVLFEVPERELDEAARVATAAMRGAFALRVPLRVEARAGERWSELAALEVDEPAQRTNGSG